MTRVTNAPTGPTADRNSLAWRLMLSYLAIALMSIALFAGIAAAVSAADVSALESRQRSVVTNAVTAAAAAAWARDRDWTSADLSPVLSLAAHSGADARIRSMTGHLVAITPGFARRQADPESSGTISVRGRPVGTAVIRYAAPSSDLVLQDALQDAIVGAAGLAALVALAAGLLAARTITRPFGQIIAATKARGRGDRTARVGQVRAPAEVRDLAASIDQMADTLDRQEGMRRAFVADVAHELRTPVAVLQAELEAMFDHVAEPTPDQLGSLRDEVLRLGSALDDLQSIASADACAMHLARSQCDLAGIAAGAANTLAGQFDGADLTVERRLTQVSVLGDEDRLHQIVANLLTNALKYTPAGGHVTIRTAPASPHEAVLQVIDDGIGIPADELPRIFDRFWRGRQASCTTSGSGIGLAVAAELARAHGGRLSAASEEGRGTTMTLALPRT
jgi:two-component system, OmpR family, sensor histidine kinase BaeS